MPGRNLRLLSLDGGGVRGLSSLYILKQLMEVMTAEERRQQGGSSKPPKPCEYFDMIGGTSTGGLIAIMLGRLRMDIDDCIAAYLALSTRIFTKKRHRFTLKGEIQGRFDTQELERAIKEVIVQQGFDENVLLKDEDAACKVFVCATAQETRDVVHFTSYPSQGSSDLYHTTKVWEAARATSAAPSFFEPIKIGPLGEEFLDGATGANNPVHEVWSEAQYVWSEEVLDRNLNCLISIGTGVPAVQRFGSSLFQISRSLRSIATETEKTAQSFARMHPHLCRTNRYFRFNVPHGLENIRLEEASKIAEIVAATRRYVQTESVIHQMRRCGKVPQELEKNDDIDDKYRIAFKLQRTPSVKEFIPRNSELEQIEQHLLPGSTKQMRRKVFVLHGVGGSGKSQLALEFARKHQRTFSAVFWLNGDTKYHLEQCIADIALQLPDEHLSEACRRFRDGSSQDIDLVVKHVLEWFTESGNNKWLLIFDNVDRDQSLQDADAYDVVSYFPNADQGSILVTTRLTRLGQLGKSLRLQGMTPEQGSRLLHSHIGRPVEGSEELVKELGGLPLALAQAGAFMHQTNSSVDEYLRYYRETWSRLFEETSKSLLQNDSQPVVTTWELSYRQVENEDSNAAKLLQVCSCLSSWDIWYGLFSPLLTEEAEQTNNIPDWFRVCIQGELNFKRAIKTLLDYSMLEPQNDPSAYFIQPVVHEWCFNFRLGDNLSSTVRLATMIVASAIKDIHDPRYRTLSRRLYPHCERISRLSSEVFRCNTRDEAQGHQLIDSWFHLADFLQEYGRFTEAETLFQQALLQGERSLGPCHWSTIKMLYALGTLYSDQKKFDKGEELLQAAFSKAMNTRGSRDDLTLEIVQSLGTLYSKQGKFKDAENMYKVALEMCNEGGDKRNPNAMTIFNNLGLLYMDEGRLKAAERMLVQAQEMCKELKLDSENILALMIISNLARVYYHRGKLKKAEEMHLRALEALESVFGKDNIKTQAAANCLGHVYFEQGRLEEAEKTYEYALAVFKEKLGIDEPDTIIIEDNLRDVRKEMDRRAKKARLFYLFA